MNIYTGGNDAENEKGKETREADKEIRREPWRNSPVGERKTGGVNPPVVV